MNYPQAVEWMSGLRRLGIKLGLERFTEVLARAGNPELKYPTVHIAGTNGKGSVTSMIAGALKAAGYHTGHYLSPYVFDLRERIQLDGQMIPKEQFAQCADTARQIIETVALTEHGYATEFEAKTLIGFLYYAQQQVDVAVIETGLGGRLDATNLIKPEVCVITNTSMDHMEYLGPTLRHIAWEKAGIIKPGVPVVTATTGDSRTIIRHRAGDLGCQLTVCGYSEDRVCDVRIFPEDSEGYSVIAKDFELRRLKPKLAGKFQAVNAACAAAALFDLRSRGWKLTAEQIRLGIESTWLPGRMQVICTNPLVIADAAHNDAAADALAQALEATEGSKAGVILVVGMTGGHDPVDFLARLKRVTKRVICTQPAVTGAHPPEAIARAAQIAGLEHTIASNVAEAMDAAENLANCNGGIVCVTGSFYLIGDLPDKWRGSDKVTS